jgi:hypothetical protein
MTAVIPEEQSKYIYRTSYLTLLTFAYALYKKQYSLCLCPAAIFTSSVIYWYKAEYDWRRYTDMVVVKSAILYQHVMAYNAQYAFLYYPIFGVGMIAYPIGIYYHRKDELWKSTYAHITLHLCGNIASCILYSGYLKA